MPARAVSSPTAVISTRRPESVATVPATTVSPSPRRTGFDSPVIIDSSMLAEPARIRPSAGTRPPGRTTTRSPSRRSVGATSSVSSPTTRSAWSGSSAASESSAEVVWARDRISIQWPSSMITISSASSHQKSSSWSSTPRLAPQEARKATVMARPMSSIIPGCRRRTSSTAPVRNGRPPHTYMTVPSSGEIQPTQPAVGQGVAEQHREHAGEPDHRHREHQHDPEQPPELADMVAVPAVTPMPAVPPCHRRRCAAWSSCPPLASMLGMCVGLTLRRRQRDRLGSRRPRVHGGRSPGCSCWHGRRHGGRRVRRVSVGRDGESA